MADMETLGRVGWVGGLHESRMWGRIQMERGSKTMMESDCCLRPCGRCWRQAGDRPSCPSCRRHPRCHSAVGGVADRF